jgi:pimeloyl-ACP methyl ester carboxylesterase
LSGARREAVILVHGIWLMGLVMVPLQRRLAKAGYDARVFAYPSLRATPAENARRLAREIGRLKADVVHLVGHSLGGLVVLHLLESGAPAKVGRCVLMGTPASGSAVARFLARHPLSRRILGRSVERGLLGEGPHGVSGHEVGVIAGALPVGVGHLLGGLDRPHDGTVAVAETAVPGCTAATTLAVSHTGLVYSAQVAECTITFLQRGRFA